MNKISILNQLENYSPFDAMEHQHLHQILDFIKTNDDLFTKKNVKGHITASAVVVDNTGENILLIWHEKLNRWLQPGGHVETEEDSSLITAATRELMEETNLGISDFSAVSESPFDLDVHIIPQRKNEQEHFHFDFRFLFKCRQGIELSNDYKWVPVEQLVELDEASLSRFAEKIETTSFPVT